MSRTADGRSGIRRPNLGARIRDVRTARGLTLKDVEASSGFSATHISEIERDRTSPTIGALVRIAEALGKDPSFFLAERVLEPTSVSHGLAAASGGAGATAAGVRMLPLSAGVVGGRFRAYHVIVSPGEEASFPAHFGEECGYVLTGRVDVRVGETTSHLGDGDGFHYVSREDHAVRNPGPDIARLIVFTDRSSLA